MSTIPNRNGKTGMTEQVIKNPNVVRVTRTIDDKTAIVQVDGAGKHTEQLLAWMRGEPIEMYTSDNHWLSINTPNFNCDLIYRVRPKTLTFADLKVGEKFMVLLSNGEPDYNGSVFMRTTNMGGGPGAVYMVDRQYWDGDTVGRYAKPDDGAPVRRV